MVPEAKASAAQTYTEDEDGEGGGELHPYNADCQKYGAIPTMILPKSDESWTLSLLQISILKSSHPQNSIPHPSSLFATIPKLCAARLSLLDYVFLPAEL